MNANSNYFPSYEILKFRKNQDFFKKYQDTKIILKKIKINLIQFDVF